MPNLLLVLLLCSLCILAPTSKVCCQDSSECQIIYQYNQVEMDMKDLSMWGMEITYLNDTLVVWKTIVKRGSIDDKSQGFKSPVPGDTFIINESNLYYYFGGQKLLVYGFNKFKDRDTTVYQQVKGDEILLRRYLIPDRSVYQHGEIVYRYSTLDEICHYVDTIASNCRIEDKGFIDFHPLYGIVRFGNGMHNYYEIANYQETEKFYNFTKSRQCDSVRNKLFKRW